MWLDTTRVKISKLKKIEIVKNKSGGKQERKEKKMSGNTITLA